MSSYSHDEKSKLRTREERFENNRTEKRALVNDGCAHGVLVYAADDPVGWCQYGLREELPRTDDSRNYRKFPRSVSQGRMWRITCFVVDQHYRGKGLASFALRAALESIRKQGGGMVESYPVIETDQGSNHLYCGTVGMFERVGFRIVGPYATGRTKTLVMRRSIRGTRAT
ncbi:MAG TPA: GNAT family N-acetyltransferase [Candidatus Bathyarchaeia archaeon]|nr:GNAT family N-acetyltransferase [Candidatus Bathyarchaeia archaeon]